MIVPTEALPLLDVVAKFSPHSLCNLRRGVEKERCMGMMGACRGRQLHFLMFVLVEQKSIEGTSCFLSSAPSNRSNRICFLLLSTVIIMTIY